MQKSTQNNFNKYYTLLTFLHITGFLILPTPQKMKINENMTYIASVRNKNKSPNIIKFSSIPQFSKTQLKSRDLQFSQISLGKYAMIW